MAHPKLTLEEVFVTEGVPEYTFVKPPNYADILLDIRRAGKPVVLEGQSGTGKTTCVRRILEELADGEPTEYLTARDAIHVTKIEAIASGRVVGRFVIDDFHRLADDLQKSLADIAKTSAEMGDPTKIAKLVIIGINQVGSQLIQLVPDIAKRTGIHRIKPGSVDDISKLIERGSERLNIVIQNANSIYDETHGDYWLTQHVCQSICLSAGITDTAPATVNVAYDKAAIRERVVDRLYASYYPPVKEFCRGRRFRPTNDPYYKLLRAVGAQESSIVDLNGLANALPELRGSINGIKEHRLPVLLESKGLAAKHFYYNEETKNFAIEDPALFYFIKHLDWNKLRQDCGFTDASDRFEFEVAISFAGENRDLARFIAESLGILDVAVFFDEMFEANFLGKAWGAKFNEIFREKSRLVVCLLDAHHLRKVWPTFEREHFIPRVSEESVIPIFLDDSKFPGIPQDISGIHFAFDPGDPEWKTKATDDIVLKLIDRLSS